MAHHRSDYAGKKERAQELARQGLDAKTIAERLGVSYSVAWKWARKAEEGRGESHGMAG